MSRKDYERIAAALASVEGIVADTDYRGIGSGALRLAVDAVAGALREDNPRFDPERFIAAALPAQRARMTAAAERARATLANETVWSGPWED